jgi:hypothetical protein
LRLGAAADGRICEASIQNGRQQYLSLKLNSKIPNHMSWTVKMRHFGKDALASYLGQKFDMTWEDSLNVFHHSIQKIIVIK